MNVSWTVSVRPSGAGIENRHFDIRIDMKSNSLGHFTQLEAFVGIGYIMPTIRENISGGIKVLIRNIECQHLRE